jgi:hypothetical protein
MRKPTPFIPNLPLVWEEGPGFMRARRKRRPRLSAPLQRFLFDNEIVRVAADAHPEAGVDPAFFLASAQNEFLVALVAPNRHFHPLR